MFRYSLLALFVACVASACTTPIEPVRLVQVDEPQDLISTLETDGRFSELLAAIERAGLTPLLVADGPFTIFAPADGSGTATDPGLHIAPGTLSKVDLEGIQGRIASLSGEIILVDGKQPTGVSLAQGAAIIQSDIPATNGLIHFIDAPLQP